jgi:hypothetical protein
MPPRSVPPFDLNAFSTPFRAESDRACAVLGAALLDARLESLFERRLRCFADRLLKPDGALGSFSARIHTARALAWIATDVQRDLDIVRSIRNEFAHNADHELSFANQSIADKCRALHTSATLVNATKQSADIPHPNFSPEVILAMGAQFESPRQRYEITVELLAQHLDELPAQASEYEGPDLDRDLWRLGSFGRILEPPAK